MEIQRHIVHNFTEEKWNTNRQNTGSHNTTGHCLSRDPENPPAAPEPKQAVVIVGKYSMKLNVLNWFSFQSINLLYCTYYQRCLPGTPVSLWCSRHNYSTTECTSLCCRLTLRYFTALNWYKCVGTVGKVNISQNNEFIIVPLSKSLFKNDSKFLCVKEREKITS